MNPKQSTLFSNYNFFKLISLLKEFIKGNKYVYFCIEWKKF